MYGLNLEMGAWHSILVAEVLALHTQESHRGAAHIPAAPLPTQLRACGLGKHVGTWELTFR